VSQNSLSKSVFCRWLSESVEGGCRAGVPSTSPRKKTELKTGRRDVLASYIDAKQNKGMDSLQRGLGDGPSTIIITETETHSRANVKVKNNQFALEGGEGPN
jgi:hypothetical protein